MPTVRALIYHRRFWLVVLLALALTARILIPQGWMPSAANGHVQISLCSGNGVITAWVDADGKIHKSDPLRKAAADQPCGFAALGSAAAAPTSAPSLPRSFVIAMPIIAWSKARTGHGLVAPPPFSTGPPILN
jgi:hypothetical protein